MSRSSTEATAVPAVDEARGLRLRYAANYFFQFATLGVFLPYFGLYMQSLGFDGRHIGYLALSFPLVQLFAPPIYGWLADRRLPRRAIYRLALLAALVVFPVFYQARSFGLLFVAIGVYALFRTPIVALLNAGVLDLIASTGRGDYGRIRLGGSVGFILFVALAGFWSDLRGIAHVLDLVVFGLIGQLLVGWHLPLDRHRRAVAEHGRGRGGWRAFVTDPTWLAFLVGLGLSRTAEGGYNIFYSVHVVDLGYASSTAGALWGLAVLSEVVVLLFSRRILATTTIPRILLACYALAALRWWGIAHARGLLVLVVLQALHGFTFGLFYVAAVAWAHRHAPDGLVASAQGVINAVMFGLAGIAGQLVAGYAYDLGGGRLIFEVSAVLALGSVVSALALVRRR